MNFIDRLVRSNGYKNFMAKLYGWGAAVVIVGALFKILHWPGANIMLMVGMFTESVIFFLSAFEPPHMEFNWALVYPELATGEEVEPSKRDKKKQLSAETPTQQLDKMLEEAKIGPDLIESLASGMRNLGDNAKKLAGMSDATVASDTFVSNLTKAAESVRNMTLKYDKIASSLETDASASTAYVESLKKATTAVNQMAAAYEQTTNYKSEMDKLTNNIAALSKVYGNMLAAMGQNPNK